VAKIYFQDDRHRLDREYTALGVHLSMLVPQRFAPKQFADPHFQVAAHVANHVARFRARLASADRTLDEILSA